MEMYPATLLCGLFKISNKQNMNINFTTGEVTEEEKKHLY